MKREFGCFLLFLLLLFTACDGERGREMSALLDRADSLNRAYVPMTGGLDSLLRDAADYYDRHGSANEQMRAHYLLGCAYRDMGEAPAALQSYQDAVDRADTTSTDCDIKRLMSVYGQMATLFNVQNLPTDEIESINMRGKLALKMKDTMQYIRNIEMLARPYYLLDDTTKAIETLQKAKELYTRYGYTQEAVSTNALLISFCINRGQLSEAGKIMQEFETKSGLFDENGNIARGREIYYSFKGNYYIARHQLDSAEYYMRKLLEYEPFRGNAYRGLMHIYRYKENADSTNYYSSLFEKEIDKRNSSVRTEAVHRLSSLYKYQRFQRITAEEILALTQTRAQRNSYAFLLIIVLLLLLWGIWMYRDVRNQRKKELSELHEIHEQLTKARSELVLLQQHEQDYRSLIAEKKEEIASLESKLNTRKSSETLLKGSDIYEQFHSLANTGRTPSNEDWETLLSLMQDLMPGFYEFMATHKHEMNTAEYYICLLTRIYVTPKAIGTMLGTSAPYISKVRREMTKRFFKEGEKPSDFDKQICEII